MDQLQAEALMREQMPAFAQFMREQGLRGLSVDRLTKISLDALDDGIRGKPYSKRLVRNLRDAVASYAQGIVQELKSRELSAVDDGNDASARFDGN